MSEAAVTEPNAPRVLSDQQRKQLSQLRAQRRSFVAFLLELGGTDQHGGRLASANLTLALRHIEDAESRAERHIRTGSRD